MPAPNPMDQIEHSREPAPALNRRDWLKAMTAAAGLSVGSMGTSPTHPIVAADALKPAAVEASQTGPALISITLDLEMSRNFPSWETMHWDYEKGNLDEATKKYAVAAGKVVRDRGGVIHYFCVGRVLEQENVDWLRDLAAAGHPIGNHTYDHIYLLADKKEDLQFRFKRSPWLLRNMTVAEAIADNIQLTTTALEQRCGIATRGFRTPGGFATGLKGREDLQKLLLGQGFKWVSSMYPSHLAAAPQQPPSAELINSVLSAQSAAQPFVYPSGLVELPMSPISDIGAFRTGRWKLDEFVAVTKQAVEWVIERGLTFDFLAHPSCLGVMDPEFKTVRMICDLVEKSNGRAKIVPLDDLVVRAKTPAAS